MDYVDLDDRIDFKGKSTVLPGGLAETVDKAEIFSAESTSENQVFVQMKEGKLRIKGEGVHGWYEERRKIAYSGDPIAFFVHPNVFWKQVQNLDKFSLAINSPVNDPTGKTPKATLYGIPVYISTNVQQISGTVGRSNALVHKDALHSATSPLGTGGSKSGGSMTGKHGVRVQSSYIPDYLSTITTADLLYGVVENRDTNGVWIRTAN